VNVVQRVLTAAGVSPAASVQAATWEAPHETDCVPGW